MYTIEIKNKETGKTVVKDESKWILACWDEDGGPYLAVFSHDCDWIDNFRQLLSLEKMIQDGLERCPELKRVWEHRAELVDSTETIDVSGLLQ